MLFAGNGIPGGRVLLLAACPFLNLFLERLFLFQSCRSGKNEANISWGLMRAAAVKTHNKGGGRGGGRARCCQPHVSLLTMEESQVTFAFPLSAVRL